MWRRASAVRDTVQVQLPLLDYLAWQAGCAYLSDLHFLTPAQRVRLRRAVEALPPESVPLRSWNDAAAYIAGAGPAATPEAAREALLLRL